MKTGRLVVLWALCGIVLHGHALADTIHLKNGGKIEAAAWRVAGDRLEVETESGVFSIDRADVASIDKSSRPSEPLTTSGRGALPAPATRGNGTRPKQTAAGGESVRSSIADGNEALRRKDFSEALSSFLAALAGSPDSREAGLGAARAALGMGDAGSAAGWARQTVGYAPDSADAWFVLGHAEYQLGELAAAQSAWEHGQALEPRAEIRDWIERVVKEQKTSSGFHALRSSRFTLEYDAENAPRVAGEAIAYLETAFDDMARVFRHNPDRRIGVVYYPRESFHELTGLDETIAGLFDGKVRIPSDGPDVLTDEGRRVLRHELAHAFIASKTHGNCPRWLHEGLAQLVEPRSARGRERQVLARVGGPEGGAVFTYLTALSLVEYLESRYGETSVLTLLDKLGEGASFEEACRAALGPGFEEIVRGWTESLHAAAGV